MPRPTSLSGDDPLEVLAGDALGRDRLADRISRILDAIATQADSSVVALVGPWGSGKTTLLNAVAAQLGTSESWRLAWHNPWAYSSLDAAVVGFFAELQGALPDDEQAQDRRSTMASFARKIAPFGAIGGVVGLDLTSSLAAVGELIEGDRSPQALREELAVQLLTLDRKVLVILDDLDRLDAGQLLLTFKLVRLLGRLPHVYYLLSYDEATLVDVLQRTDLVGEGDARAHNYLEKMVQVRLDIPPLLDEQRSSLIDFRLEQFLQTNTVVLEGEDLTRLQQAWVGCLASYMGQPRAINRLMTQVEATWPEVAGEVDFVDFFLMTFLRTFERGAFDLVVHRREELVGLMSFLSADPREESNSDRWHRWISMLKDDARTREPERVAVLLSEMFLVLRGARENMTYGSHHLTDVVRRRGVGCSDFFDRYTQLGVPPSDLSDQLLADAIDELRTGEIGEAAIEVEQTLVYRPNLVISRLAGVDGVLPLPEPATIRLLARHYNLISELNAASLERPGYRLLRLSANLLDRMPVIDALALLSELCTSEDGLGFAADVMRLALLDESTEQDRPWVDSARATVAEAIEEMLRQASIEPATEASIPTARLVDALRHTRSEEEAKDFIWKILDGPGAWSLVDFLALLVPVGTASDGRSSWPSIGELGAGDIDSVLGVDRVLALTDIDIPPNDAAGSNHRRRGVDLDSRREYVQEVLARLRRDYRAH